MKEGFPKPDDLNSADAEDGEFSEVTDLSETTLQDLAAGINQVQTTINGNMDGLLTLAAEAGVLLINAKAQVKHGEWEAWVKENTTVGARQARRYMTLGANPELMAKRTSEADLKSIEDMSNSIARELKGKPQPKPRATKEQKLQRQKDKAMKAFEDVPLGDKPRMIKELERQMEIEVEVNTPRKPGESKAFKPLPDVESSCNIIDGLSQEEQLDLVRHIEEKVGADAITGVLSIEAPEQAPAKPEPTMTEYVKKFEGLLTKTRWEKINGKGPNGLPTFTYMVMTQAKKEVEAAIDGLYKKDQQPAIRAVTVILDYVWEIIRDLVRDAIVVENHQIATKPHNAMTSVLALANKVGVEKKVMRAMFNAVAKEVHPDNGGDVEMSKELGKIKARAKQGGLL